MQQYRVGRDVTVLVDPLPVPGLGVVPVNAFVLQAAEPVVVDTGLGLAGAGFVEALGSVVEPQDVRWIWLTHPDRDHVGGLADLLAAAPDAIVVTTFLGARILALQDSLPTHRVRLIAPGRTLEVGDRRLTAFRPPLYDSPATVGFFDPRSRACFSADCFGAALPTAEAALCPDVAGIPPGQLRVGQLLWASATSPWVHTVDPGRFRDSCTVIRAMDPAVVLSSHLPAAVGRTEELLQMLDEAPDTLPFVEPDQDALGQLTGLES